MKILTNAIKYYINPNKTIEITKKYYPPAFRGHQADEDQGCSMQHDVHVINHACSIQSMYVVVLQSCSVLPSYMELASCSNQVSR